MATEQQEQQPRKQICNTWYSQRPTTEETANHHQEADQNPHILSPPKAPATLR